MPASAPTTSDLALISRLLHVANGPLQVRPGQPAPTRMAGVSAAMQEVFRQLALAAGGDHPVLITGPSGVGKSLAAWLLHHLAPQAGRSFHTIDVRPLPLADIMRRMADAAGEGTLVVEGAHLLSAAQIAGLVQRSGTRLVLDAESDPHGVCEARWPTALPGLQVIAIPPLRARPEDIVPIAACLLQRLADRLELPLTVAPPVLAEMLGHDWPGNVREMDDNLAWAARQAVGGTILPEHLRLRPRGPAQVVPPLRDLAEQLLSREPGRVYVQWQDALDAVLLSRALARTRGNQLQAAALLGLHRTTVRKRCRALGLCARAGDVPEDHISYMIPLTSPVPP